MSPWSKDACRIKFNTNRLFVDVTSIIHRYTSSGPTSGTNANLKQGEDKQGIIDVCFEQIKYVLSLPRNKDELTPFTFIVSTFNLKLMNYILNRLKIDVFATDSIDVSSLTLNCVYLTHFERE